MKFGHLLEVMQQEIDEVLELYPFFWASTKQYVVKLVRHR